MVFDNSLRARGAGDVLDLRGLTGVTITYTNPDPFTGTSESGTATYQNAGGQTVTIAFSEIETVLTSANGVVDGTPGDDVMTLTSGPGGVPFTDAQGEVTVRLAKNGRIVNGQGADTDIIVASAKAYLAALNKLHSKTERVYAQGPV